MYTLSELIWRHFDTFIDDWLTQDDSFLHDCWEQNYSFKISLIAAAAAAAAAAAVAALIVDTE